MILSWRNTMKKNIFLNFAEFWHFTKKLSMDQRDTLFNAMPSQERRKLKKSYQEEGWGDLFIRNFLDSELDKIKKDTGIDMLFVRTKVLDGTPFYMPRKRWKSIYNTFSKFGRHSRYIIGGIRPELMNKNTIVLVSGAERPRDDDKDGFDVDDESDL